jgi:large repetitive protein
MAASIQKHILPALIVALVLMGSAARATAASLMLVCPVSTGQVGAAYSSALVATGGMPPYTFSISAGSLPIGLAINASTGAVTGTPTDLGSFSFTAQVTDSTFASTTASCSMTISQPTPPPLTLACPVSTGQAGAAYSSALVATGGVPPYTFSISAGSLPSGLTLNASTGAVTGTPTCRGSFNFTAKVVDSSGNPATNTVTVGCSITVAPQKTGHCTYSWGFYANHDSAVALLIPSAGLTVGTVVYTFEEIEGILAHKPVAGNGLVSLAHQLIAAELNILGGSAAPASVTLAINQANVLIGGLTVPGSGLTPYGYLSPSQTGGLETTLDSFNEGKLGPGPCS